MPQEKVRKPHKGDKQQKKDFFKNELKRLTKDQSKHVKKVYKVTGDAEGNVGKPPVGRLGNMAPWDKTSFDKWAKEHGKVHAAETSDKPASGVLGIRGVKKVMARPYKEWVAKFRHANGNNAQDKKVARTQAPGQPGRPEYNKGQMDTATIERNEARVLNNPKLKIRSYEDNSYNVSGVKSKTPDIWHKAYSAQKPPAMKSSVKSSGKPADVNKLLNKAYSKPKHTAK